MHDLLFEAFDSWKDLSVDDFRGKLSDYAALIGLDAKRFDEDLDTGKFKAQVVAARDLAVNIGLSGTPFLIVNESPWPDSLPYMAYANLEGVVKFYAVLPDLQYAEYPEMTIDAAKKYTATITTDAGDIVVELYPDKAPLAVNSFVFLARDGWYDGVSFHRVVDNFVVQAGDPTGLGVGSVGYIYKTETSPDVSYDGPGWLGVARTDQLDTNGAQFFITRSGIDSDSLSALNDGPYTIFGKVLEGQAVVDALTVRDPQSSPEIPPSVIERITVREQ